MAKSKNKRDPLPEQFSSLEEAGEFWDTHSGADYEEYMQEVHFEVDLKRSVKEVRVADHVLREVRKIAQQQGRKPAELVREAVAEYTVRHRAVRRVPTSVASFSSGKRDLATRDEHYLKGMGARDRR